MNLEFVSVVSPRLVSSQTSSDSELKQRAAFRP
jgi:hypothetical protein